MREGEWTQSRPSVHNPPSMKPSLIGVNGHPYFVTNVKPINQAQEFGYCMHRYKTTHKGHSLSAPVLTNMFNEQCIFRRLLNKQNLQKYRHTHTQTYRHTNTRKNMDTHTHGRSQHVAGWSSILKCVVAAHFHDNCTILTSQDSSVRRLPTCTHAHTHTHTSIHM